MNYCNKSNNFNKIKNSNDSCQKQNINSLEDNSNLNFSTSNSLSNLNQHQMSNLQINEFSSMNVVDGFQRKWNAFTTQNKAHNMPTTKLEENSAPKVLSWPRSSVASTTLNSKVQSWPRYSQSQPNVQSWPRPKPNFLLNTQQEINYSKNNELFVMDNIKRNNDTSPLKDNYQMTVNNPIVRYPVSSATTRGNLNIQEGLSFKRDSHPIDYNFSRLTRPVSAPVKQNYNNNSFDKDDPDNNKFGTPSTKISSTQETNNMAWTICKICDMTFKNETIYNMHIRTISHIGKSQIKKSKKESSFELSSESMLMDEDGDYRCEECKIDFPNQAAFKRHNYYLHTDAIIEEIKDEEAEEEKNNIEENEDEEDTTQCKLCNIQFVKEQAYHIHIRSLSHFQKTQKLEQLKNKKSINNNEHYNKNNSQNEQQKDGSDYKESTSKMKDEKAEETKKDEKDDDDEDDDISQCKICNIQFTREQAYHVHIRSTSHFQKMRELEGLKNSKNYKSADSYCDICSFSFANKEVYKSHLSGLVHKQKLAALNKSGMSNQKLTNQNLINDEDISFTATIVCKICDVPCTGSKSYNTHLNGIKHKKKLQKLSELEGHQMKEIEIKNIEATLELSKPNSKNKIVMIQQVLDACVEPLIGLDYMTEYQMKDSSIEPRYVCDLCESKMDSRQVINHVTGIRHRSKYFKFHNIGFYKKLWYLKKSEKAIMSKDMAWQMIKKEGVRRIRVKVQTQAFEDAKEKEDQSEYWREIEDLEGNRPIKELPGLSTYNQHADKYRIDGKGDNDDDDDDDDYSQGPILETMNKTDQPANLNNQSRQVTPLMKVGSIRPTSSFTRMKHEQVERMKNPLQLSTRPNSNFPSMMAQPITSDEHKNVARVVAPQNNEFDKLGNKEVNYKKNFGSDAESLRITSQTSFRGYSPNKPTTKFEVINYDHKPLVSTSIEREFESLNDDRMNSDIYKTERELFEVSKAELAFYRSEKALARSESVFCYDNINPHHQSYAPLSAEIPRWSTEEDNRNKSLGYTPKELDDTNKYGVRQEQRLLYEQPPKELLQNRLQKEQQLEEIIGNDELVMIRVTTAERIQATLATCNMDTEADAEIALQISNLLTQGLLEYRIAIMVKNGNKDSQLDEHLNILKEQNADFNPENISYKDGLMGLALKDAYILARALPKETHQLVITHAMNSLDVVNKKLYGVLDKVDQIEDDHSKESEGIEKNKLRPDNSKFPPSMNKFNETRCDEEYHSTIEIDKIPQKQNDTKPSDLGLNNSEPRKFESTASNELKRAVQNNDAESLSDDKQIQRIGSHITINRPVNKRFRYGL